MLERFGQIASRHAVLVILSWAASLSVLLSVGPSWESVVRDGEFVQLPLDAPSRAAEALYRSAFTATLDDAETDPGDADGLHGQRLHLRAHRRATVDPLHGNIVIIVRRVIGGQPGLRADDWTFIERELVERLEAIRETVGWGYESRPGDNLPGSRERLPESERIVDSILAHPPPAVSFAIDAGRPPNDPEDVIGSLLVSEDNQATLVVLQLKTDYLDRANNLVISEVERLLASQDFKRRKPAGLAFDLSGSAVVGRDFLRAEEVSSARTSLLAIVLSIVFLAIVHRAPLLAFIPVAGVAVSLELTRQAAPRSRWLGAGRLVQRPGYVFDVDGLCGWYCVQPAAAHGLSGRVAAGRALMMPSPPLSSPSPGRWESPPAQA
ncbi:MAG: MMPL family transporter [Planctomycetaceae bacterium]